MISILNYGMGNIGSIQNMFKYLGFDSKIINTPEEVLKADKILLPGVGAFDAAMKKLKNEHFDEAIKELSDKGIPLLGICLGMQLLTNSSEEGDLIGLGLIDAETLGFNKLNDTSKKIPHMGWNVVKPQAFNQLLKGFDEWNEVRFYFVHSFYVKCKNRENVVLTTEYGISFDSMIQKDNVWGAQFHPEKSHKFGMKLFENFARL